MAGKERGRGLMGRVRRRVKGGISKVKEGLQSVNDEAKHPGRPSSYQAATSPFWHDSDMKPPAPDATPTAAAPSAPAPAVPQPTDSTDRDGEPFWFMEGQEDLEGWEQTNPSEAWRERHGVAEPKS
jgi:hypothetical protein